MQHYTITTSPYEGDSAKLHDYCVSMGFTFKTKVLDEEDFNMEFVIFSFENYPEYLSANTYYENYI